MIDYKTSPIKWCEPEFVYTYYIVEFWNTITSLSFSLLAYYSYYDIKKRKLSIRNNKRINLMFFLMSLIGPTSFFFHATLNFFAQFLDEVSIILFLLFCMKEVLLFSNILLYFLSIFCMIVSWFFPSISPFILLTTGTLLTLNTRKAVENSENSLKVWNKGIYYGIFAIFLWLMDFICIINTHSYWHIFISISVYHFNLIIIKENICKSNNIELVDSIIPYIKDKK